MEIKNNEKIVTKIYRGGALLYEQPSVFGKINQIKGGDITISGIAYPENAKVTCNIRGREYTTTSNSYCEFEIELNTALSRGSLVAVRISKNGWRSRRNRYSVN